MGLLDHAELLDRMRSQVSTKGSAFDSMIHELLQAEVPKLEAAARALVQEEIEQANRIRKAAEEEAARQRAMCMKLEDQLRDARTATARAEAQLATETAKRQGAESQMQAEKLRRQTAETELRNRKTTVEQVPAEPDKPVPYEFNVVRGSDGLISKITMTPM